MEGHHSSLTVCPCHREVYGVGWKTGKVCCSIPSKLAGHKSSSAKGDRGINSKESAFVLFTGKTFLPIGTQHLANLMTDFSVEKNPDLYGVGEASPTLVVPEESEKSASSEELTAEIKKLQIGDESYLPSSDTASTASSTGDDGKFQLQKARLSAFLEECNLKPLGIRWKDWSQATERTQQRYVERSSEIVKAVLS
ncbi:hypothetical protein P5673_016528, partial [Acropora cervicornis]